jgi:hypothetical protein
MSTPTTPTSYGRSTSSVIHIKVLLSSCPSLLSSLLSLHSFFFCSLTLNRSKDAFHALVIRAILLSLLLLLHTGQESSIFAKFTDSTLPFLLVLIAQFGGLVPLVIRILSTKVRRRIRLKFGYVGWDGYWLVCLQEKGFPALARKFQKSPKRVIKNCYACLCCRLDLQCQWRKTRTYS